MAHLLAFGTLAIGVPLNIFVTIRLWWLYRANPELKVIRDRGIVSTAILLVVIIFSLIFLNNDLADPVVSIQDTQILRRLTIFLMATVPSIYWLWLYRRH